MRGAGFGLWTSSEHGQLPSSSTPARSAWTGEGARPHTPLALPLQCAVEGLVEGCFGFFVIRGCDLALFFFYL